MHPLDDAAQRLAQRRHDPHADEATFQRALAPGQTLGQASVLAEGALDRLAPHLGGCHRLLYFVRDDGRLEPDERHALHQLTQLRPPVLPLLVAPGLLLEVAGLEVLRDLEGELARLADVRGGTAYLIDPQRRVLGRWRRLDVADVAHVLTAHPAA